MTINFDPESEARLKRVAEARGSSAEAILREALERYLEHEQEAQHGQDRHPSGKPWPRREPVGGIITPV